MAALVEILNSTIGSAEALSRVIPMIEEFNEVVGITDAMVEARQKLELNDPVGMTETISHIKGIIQILDETVGITETSDDVSGFVKMIGSVVGITQDVVDDISTGIQYITETIRVNGPLFLPSPGSYRFGETVAMIAHQPMVDETMGIAEALTYRLSRSQVIDEPMGITEGSVDFLGAEQVEVIDEAMGLAEDSISYFYTDVGYTFTYFASNWSAAVNWFLEARGIAEAAIGHSARLYDVTDSVQVEGSVVHFTDLINTLTLRSGPFTLTDGNLYNVQLGRKTSASGPAVVEFARLIGARNIS